MINYTEEQKKLNEKAAQLFLTMNMLEQILARADNPKELADYLTHEMRELLSGRIVALVECSHISGTGEHTIISVCPPRKFDEINGPDLEKLCDLSHELNRAEFWGPDMGPAAAREINANKCWGYTIVLPLLFGENRYGVMFIFDVTDLNNAGAQLNMVETLSNTIALILKNSIQYHNLEKAIEERTREIRRGEERLSYVMKATSDGYWDWDVPSGKTYFSPRYYEMIGYAPDEFEPCYESWKARIHPDDVEEAMKKLEYCFENKTPNYEIEFRMRTKSGDYLWILGRGMVIARDAGGNPLRMCGTHTDISARKKYEAELIEARKRAEEASCAKSMFLANMSHELRTPMNGIIGFTDILAASGLNDEQREFNDMVKISSRHLLDIINDILDFSRIEARKLTLDKKTFDICETVKNSKLMVETQLKQKNLKLFFDIDAMICGPVIGDQLKFRQILLNLLMNAVKFTPAGKKIVVGLERTVTSESGCVMRLSVADEGIGIAREKLSEIFEMFHQLDSSLNKQYGGTGLGLSIVKGLVELMGGTISVKSEPGAGSEFSVEIPFETAPSDIAASDGSVAAEPFGEKAGAVSVLLAEDDEISCQLIKTLSKRFNWNVVIAHDGREAVESYMSGSFDAVIMDGQMPEMNGLDAARAIREMERTLGKRTPIIALTAYALEGDREKFMAAGMDEYVTKPIGDGKGLYDAVMKCIGD